MTKLTDGLSFVRRVSDDPKVGPWPGSSGDKSCPDVWELSDGSYAVVGYAAPRGLLANAPDDFYFDEANEHVVVVPADVLKVAASRF